MKYLKIQNQGLLDMRLISLMGATTKANDQTKIGQFGTGLKYAISYMVRHKIKFKLFIGVKEVLFTFKKVKVGDQAFDEIHCNGQTMNITTRYGYQWEAWEALREIWCNAKDEGSPVRAIVSIKNPPAGKRDATTFYIPVTEGIKKVVDGWDNYFIDESQTPPIYSDEKIAIYPNTGEMLRLYKNSVLIHTSEYQKSMFLYDLKTSDLNELRQYRGFLNNDIARAILASDRKVVAKFMADVRDKKFIESGLDWSYITPDKAKVKEIFQGCLFLHPESNGSVSAKRVLVPESLFQLLEKCGLPCEKVNTSSGGYYGRAGTGYHGLATATYKEVKNAPLSERIDSILTKYGSKAKYKIAVPIKSDFEILVIEKLTVVFNSSLDALSNTDLEAVVVIGIFHTQEGNIYKAFRRLLKFAMKSRNFKNILFGSK